ncbi:23S rRNA methyltransferase [Spirochaetia bacterium]|nr:23S rRNA methyltransferase [Spirochaetia bacterium]
MNIHMKRIILKPGEEKRILQGHPWVYDNEVDRILDGLASKPIDLIPGETADVESSRKTYLGRAFVNPNSKIIARIYSPSKEGVDKGFFKHRIRDAVERRTLTGDMTPGAFDLHRDSARLVFAEADFLPGLIIDRFVGWSLRELESAVTPRPLTFEAAESALGPPQSWLAIQFLSFGMDSRREEIITAMEEVLEQDGFIIPDAVPLGHCAGVIEKSAGVRELEGLPLQEGLIRGSFPAEGIVIFENGLPFMLNLIDGQKTGHYLDQRDNRRIAAAYIGAAGGAAGSTGTPDLRVLDAFSYTGGFGIHTAQLGAAHSNIQVTCVDSSAEALGTVRINAALNGIEDRVAAVEADVFEYLRAAEHQKACYDLIILDPPAFAKTRSALEGALRGYKEINLRAVNMLKLGGILITCSCSHALDEIRFRYMITEAAADAGKRLIMLDFRRQPADHPVLVGYEESLYLKCGIYRVV